MVTILMRDGGFLMRDGAILTGDGGFLMEDGAILMRDGGFLMRDGAGEKIVATNIARVPQAMTERNVVGEKHQQRRSVIKNGFKK